MAYLKKISKLKLKNSSKDNDLNLSDEKPNIDESVVPSGLHDFSSARLIGNDDNASKKMKLNLDDKGETEIKNKSYEKEKENDKHSNIPFYEEEDLEIQNKEKLKLTDIISILDDYVKLTESYYETFVDFRYKMMDVYTMNRKHTIKLYQVNKKIKKIQYMREKLEERIIKKE